MEPAENVFLLAIVSWMKAKPISNQINDESSSPPPFLRFVTSQKSINSRREVIQLLHLDLIISSLNSHLFIEIQINSRWIRCDTRCHRAKVWKGGLLVRFVSFFRGRSWNLIFRWKSEVLEFLVPCVFSPKHSPFLLLTSWKSENQTSKPHDRYGDVRSVKKIINFLLISFLPSLAHNAG